MTVDVKCYALAKEWLAPLGETYDGTVMQLAEVIQDAIEDFCAELEERP